MVNCGRQNGITRLLPANANRWCHRKYMLPAASNQTIVEPTLRPMQAALASTMPHLPKVPV
ncbi:hypothetical protein FOMG_19702 [Fusarium oxysporum f. sp. melonis 26406]|uniref:Uncharacterized protein n=1 Tax=Fusarium oxysporum f. sp. melonis 26406 TaxID=1089452 RepID=W9YVG4_FUSOX|nr:hypothetical protein FOMG_19702 [Fusarium oxysporum f. sp. melonis 26406]